MKKLFLFLLSCSTLILWGCSSGSSIVQEKTADAAETCAATTTSAGDVTVQVPMMVESSSTTIEAYSDEESILTARTGNAGIHYFSFHERARTYTDETGQELLKEVLTEPVFYASDPSVQDWVSGVTAEIYAADQQVSQELLSYARQDREQLGEAFYCYSHYVSMDVRRHDDEAISLLALSSVYSGGSHPNSVQDLRQLKVLSLEDVIYPEQAAALAELVRSAVENKFSTLGNDILYEDYTQTIADAMEQGTMTPYWYFSEQGLVVFFNQYELGPYAAGVIKAFVSYEDLDGIVREEYIPEKYHGTVTDVTLTREPTQGERIYYVDFSAGEPIYVSISGTASHVQVSEVFYVEQTSVDEVLLFSANRLDDAATIAVTGNLSDTNGTYVIEYYDEQGGPYAVYVQGEDVLEELP